MKRTTLISASLLLAFAGCTCGQGWRPSFCTGLNNRNQGPSNVGEPCDAGCQGQAMAAPAAVGGCETCGTAGSAYYGGYNGQVIDSNEGMPIGNSYGSMPIEYRQGSTMQYPTSTSRMEPVAAKRAN